jgi:hypothetical protein
VQPSSRKVQKLEVHSPTWIASASSRIGAFGRACGWFALPAQVFHPLSSPLLLSGFLWHRGGVLALPVPPKNRRQETWIVGIGTMATVDGHMVHPDSKDLHARHPHLAHKPHICHR